MFRDRNGKISRKAIAGYFLILNGIALVWYSLISKQTIELASLITLVSSGAGLLAATLGERKNVEPTATPNRD